MRSLPDEDEPFPGGLFESGSTFRFEQVAAAELVAEITLEDDDEAVPSSIEPSEVMDEDEVDDDPFGLLDDSLIVRPNLRIRDPNDDMSFDYVPIVRALYYYSL